MSGRLQSISSFFGVGGAEQATTSNVTVPTTIVTNGSSGDEEMAEITESGSRSPGESFPDLQHVDFCGLKSATMFQLVERIARCFDSDGDLLEGSTLPNALFLVHQWYLPSAEVANNFLQLYNSAPEYCATCRRNSFAKIRAKPLVASAERTSEDTDTDTVLDMDTTSGSRSSSTQVAPDTLTLQGEQQQQQEAAEGCWCCKLKCQVCFALRHWIHLFPIHFDANSALCGVLEEVQSRVVADGYIDLAKKLDVSTVPSYAWLRNVSVRNQIARQISLSFDQWTPEEIAVNLTHIEYKMLRRITFSEYKHYASTTNLHTTPILQRSISVFNSLSNWVQCMVLSKPTPKDRSDIMVKFANVGKRLRKLQNFNTLMAVIGGLTHSALARLTKTHSCLPQETKSDLSDFAELLSSASNFSAYRKAFLECRGFRIPIIGVHLKDLISLHSAMAEYDESGNVNCRKLGQLAAVFSHLILDLARSHNLPDANFDLINTLKVSLDIHYKDEEIYELSLKREPRTLLNVYSYTSPKPVVFADWAAGVVSIPDREVVNKHVAAMVNAVFKHYDNDRDDYISESEFASIAGNFPFIDPFCIIDKDRDGKISKTEMQEYFINQHSIEFRRGFKHNFHETTFLAPTTCAHCNKLLWGWLRQGYKCKDCGLPVHRNCKDFVVAECRSRKTSAGGTTHPLLKDRVASLPEGPMPPPMASTQVSSPVVETQNVPKKKLFINIARNRQNRAVSTVSPGESPSPEPTPPPVVDPPYKTRLPYLLGRGSKKLRTQSASDDFRFYDFRSQSPDILPALASEEVFEEESSTGNVDSGCPQNSSSPTPAQS